MNPKDLTSFSLAVFCTFFGFLAAVTMYVYYGFFLHQDLPSNIMTVTNVFIGQSFGGTIAAIFTQKKEASDAN